MALSHLVPKPNPKFASFVLLTWKSNLIKAQHVGIKTTCWDPYMVPLINSCLLKHSSKQCVAVNTKESHLAIFFYSFFNFSFLALDSTANINICLSLYRRQDPYFQDHLDPSSTYSSILVYLSQIEAQIMVKGLFYHKPCPRPQFSWPTSRVLGLCYIKQS